MTQKGQRESHSAENDSIFLTLFLLYPQLVIMISLNDLTVLFSKFTTFDYIIGGIILLFIVRGVWIGFMRQLTTFLALVGSYWIAARYIGEMMPYVEQVVHNPKIVFLVSFAILFLVSALFFIIAGKVLHRVMELTLLGWFDRFLGLLLGGAKGVVVTVLIYMLLSSSMTPSSQLFKKSITIPYLGQGAVVIRQIIHDPKIRKLFEPRQPAIKAKPVPKEKKTIEKKETKEPEKTVTQEKPKLV